MERLELGRNLIFRQFLWGSPPQLETAVAVSKEVHFASTSTCLSQKLLIRNIPIWLNSQVQTEEPELLGWQLIVRHQIVHNSWS